MNTVYDEAQARYHHSLRECGLRYRPQATRLASNVSVLGVDRANATVEALVSTPDPIPNSGVMRLAEAYTKRLDLYRLNPYGLWAHDWGSDDAAEERKPHPSALIFQALELEVRPDIGLWARLQYCVDINETARLVFALIADGYLRGFSTSTIEHWVVTEHSPSEEIDALPDYARKALLSGVVEQVFVDSELLEISNCFLPRNRQAVVRLAQDGVVSKESATILGVPDYMLQHLPADSVEAAA